jgi:hypothetical protein
VHSSGKDSDMLWLVWVLCDVLLPLALVTLGYVAGTTGAALWGVALAGIALSLACSILVTVQYSAIVLRARGTAQAPASKEP